jgi:hypothetical protein
MLLNKYRNYNRLVIVLAWSFFTSGCSNIPITQIIKTQPPDLGQTPTQPTETQIPHLSSTPAQSTESQTPDPNPSPTQPTESQTPDLNLTPTQPAQTQTPDSNPSPTQPTETQTPGSDIKFPAQSDWVDYGIILEAGAEGEWDYYLWGGFAFSVIKKDGTYYLYYQGASDYRTEFDETVLWRAIGVATSQDGIHFAKYEDNPILTWFPKQNGEEGAVSSGVTLGEQGEFLLFYGANTEESITSVNADVRMASSLDGINFTDLGMVLDHNDRSVWGSGDELFSVDAIYDQGQWVVYYIPNGSPESGMLGVAFGASFDALNQTSAVTSANNPISVWGTAGHIKLDSDTYALILNNVREGRTEVREVSLHTPNIVSEPIAVYQFDEVQQAFVLLDEETQTWFMYYRTHENSYGVKLAPAGDKPLPTSSTP